MLACPKCQRVFSHGAHFCGTCGTRLVDTASVAVASKCDQAGPAAGGQNTPAIQAKDDPADTLVRRLPVDFFRQPPRTMPSGQLQQQALELGPGDSPTISMIVSPPGQQLPPVALANLADLTPMTPADPRISQPLLHNEVDISLLSTVPATPAGKGETAENNIDPTMFFAPFLKPTAIPPHLLNPTDPYAYLKRELTTQRMEIITSMDELLPLVYENHRAENQALFVDILARQPPLEDEAWGHAAFVLGAYGNYMYRHPLDLLKKLEIWRAQLWAVYYERCYRRKYLAQRCQQLIHFCQGCAANSTFLTIALHDLATLCLYLEVNCLRKLQQMLQTLQIQPEELFKLIGTRMVEAEQERAERIANQPAPAKLKERPKLNSRPGEEKVIPEEEMPSLSPRVRKWLDFLNQEQRRAFFTSLRDDHLATVQHILDQNREPLLTALLAELIDAGPLDYQRPRALVPVRGKRGMADYDGFCEAFRLLSSTSLQDRQAALRLFEQNRPEDLRPEYRQRAREWQLYARARTQGCTRVAAEWARACQQNEASWEEIWNLAYYQYKTGTPGEAISLLAPGLADLEAPICHFQLALLCSLTLLLEPGKAGEDVLPNARVLLIRYLGHWPHPLAFLAWLVLASDIPGTLRPLDMSRYLSRFQELLEAPITLPDPRANQTEEQLNDLRDALVRLHDEETWLLWLNDYATRRPHGYRLWQRLAATAEHMQRLDRAETALQHMVEICYDLDYALAQQDEEKALVIKDLRGYLEKLFEFYQRHNLFKQGWAAFETCYPTLNHLGLWDEPEPANHTLLKLTESYLQQFRHQQIQHRLAVEEVKSRSEIRRRALDSQATGSLVPAPRKIDRRVGIFVDYENIAGFIPRGQDIESVGQALANYAAQFGAVICRWASASPRNLSNLADVHVGLEAAQFQIRYPQRELQFSASRKDLADYALLECMSEASLRDHLDVYLVVSGDRDYYERIYSLLEHGCTVRVLANETNLSHTYRELEQQRRRKQQTEGRKETDFFIDNLDEVLRFSLP